MRVYLFLSMFVCSLSFAGPSAEVLFPAAITSIYDGDTFSVSFLGCSAVLCERLPVRIAGIDTPEMRGSCPEEIEKAKEARRFLVSLLKSGGDIELRNVVRDRYYRLRASVFVGGVDVGAQLVVSGHARPYTGGRRRSWCNTESAVKAAL